MECFEAMQRDRRPEALGDLRVLPDELICAILESLSPRDVARLTCVSSVFYILCNEEPLWMTLCLKSACSQLEYKGSWKRTTLHQLDVPDKFLEACTKHLQFDGFNSLFLYKRFYRCFTSLDTFSLDKFVVKREKDLTLEDFQKNYDGQKPVLLTGLAETWPARNKWTIDELSYNYGDFMFKISQRSSKKITMKLKDYVSYMKQQHDEDPLYVFDDKFGEVAPDLLKDYTVPLIFREDFFDALDRDQRPPFRWLIIGPERSGASWHVDPALTSAWNTLLCGRKRWALYPPGRVPLGVTVHVNEEDGDVNVETPSSLQWWLDIYPLLADEDKPIECTQLPGETIFVPSGWWHCVLNLETTVAVTQNFVNSKNFEFTCLDMTPGYRHKGVCRAGLLAIDNGSLGHAKRSTLYDNSQLNDADMERKEKRLRVSSSGKDLHMCVDNENPANVALKDCYLQTLEFSYDIEYLSMFLEEDRDHYNAEWSPSNSIGQREMRMWLHKLWVEKPGIRELIWKGACLALNAEKWSARMKQICASHNLPSPSDDEKLPVGTGSNPVYLTADCVIKIYVEGGIESSIHGLGTELEFYSLLQKVDSPLKDHVPDVLASGILFQENGSIRNVPWDGKGIPYVIANCNLTVEKNNADGFPFGVWSKKQFECRKAAVPINQPINSIGGISIWPYIITKRCKGNIFAELRDILSWDDAQNLASFLGEQLHNLHTLPLPPFHTYISELNISNPKMPSLKACLGALTGGSTIPLEWQLFVETMTRRKKDISSRLEKWGDPIPRYLIYKVEEYVPDDLSVLLNTSQDEKGLVKVHKSCCWIHSDIMDDNIYMEPCSVSSFPDDDAPYASMLASGSLNGCKGSGGQKKWHPSYILDFSDLSMGDPICDLIPIHLDVFRGDPNLLKKFLESYKLPLMRRASSELEPVKYGNKFERLSYHAMCYCILHDDNVLGSIFSLWPELRTSKSWEEVEETVWGALNNYEGFC